MKACLVRRRASEWMDWRAWSAAAERCGLIEKNTHVSMSSTSSGTGEVALTSSVNHRYRPVARFTNEIDPVYVPPSRGCSVSKYSLLPPASTVTSEGPLIVNASAKSDSTCSSSTSPARVESDLITNVRVMRCRA